MAKAGKKADPDALKQQIGTLKQKAKKARKEGQREAAAVFAHGAKRAQRRHRKALGPQATAKKKG